MEPIIPYTPLLQSLITSSSPPPEIPPLSALIALQKHLDALRQAARDRLSSLRTGKERVDKLRQRDIAEARAIAAAREQERKEEKERDKVKKAAEKERQRKETEREDRERERIAQQEEEQQRQQSSGKGIAGGKSGGSSTSLGGKTAAEIKEEQEDPIDSFPVASTSMLPPPPPPPLPASLWDGDSDDSAIALTHRKKKKRKHGLITSDNEEERAGTRAGSEEASGRDRTRDRSMSISVVPPPGPAAAPVRPKIKIFMSSRRSPSPLHATPAYSAPSNIDFSLASGSRSLVPPRPPVPAPPVPGPMNQSEVNEDFSNVKAPPNQVIFGTFWQGIEPYVRQIGEEDLAFLKAYKDEDTEPYVLPPLGKPYQQVWDEEDRLIAQGLPVPVISSTSPYRPNANNGPVNKTLDYPRMSRKESEYDSRDLREEDLVVEDKGAGPLTERVVSALLAAREESDAPIGFGSGSGSSAAEGSGSTSAAQGMQVDGASGGAWGGPSDPGAERLGMGDMEARMRKELQAVGLLGDEEIDWSLRADDEISTSLRQTQRLLTTQLDLNSQRRSVLLSIAQDRLAYAEYLQCLEGLDRIIDSGWHKRQRLLQKQAKRKETKGARGGGAATEKEEREKEQNRKLGEALRTAIGRRKKFVEFVGGVFKRAEEGEEGERQGRFLGLPKESVYREPVGEGTGSGSGGGGGEEAEIMDDEAEVAQAMEGVEAEEQVAAAV